MRLHAAISSLLVLLCGTLGAQEGSFVREFRPCYFTSGIPLSEAPSADNADVKFQLSLLFPLADDLGGKGWDLGFGYTQVSLWNLYAHSSPFYDSTFVPGIYLSRSFPAPSGERNILAGIEHRSNGRDDAYSRSINYAFALYSRRWDRPGTGSLTLSGGLRLGTGWYGDVATIDIMTIYSGLLKFKALLSSSDGKFELMAEALPILNPNIANVTAEIRFRPFGKIKNPYLFLQFHRGYDEAFRDCVTVGGPVIEADGNVPYDAAVPMAPRSFLRFGLLFAPANFLR